MIFSNCMRDCESRETSLTSNNDRNKDFNRLIELWEDLLFKHMREI